MGLDVPGLEPPPDEPALGAAAAPSSWPLSPEATVPVHYEA
jgi:hypothetical protein